MNFSFQVVRHHESADGATGDTCGPVRPAVQKGMRLLWQRGMAGPVLQVLEGGVPPCTPETDPGRLGLGRKVRPSAALLRTPSLAGLKKSQLTLQYLTVQCYYLDKNDAKFSSIK